MKSNDWMTNANYSIDSYYHAIAKTRKPFKYIVLYANHRTNRIQVAKCFRRKREAIAYTKKSNDKENYFLHVNTIKDITSFNILLGDLT